MQYDEAQLQIKGLFMCGLQSRKNDSEPHGGFRQFFKMLLGAHTNLEVQSRPDFEVDMIQAEGYRKDFDTNKPCQALLRKISQFRLVLH